ncbi:MAG: hypothetical protein KAV87_41805 [Desulfobacteraceae bacterium]|nr:hypothetical protein [Desulfobacteraceae bacterium]
MESRYSKGQRVEIVSVINEHLRAKYPEIETYVGAIGTVVESYWIGFEGPNLPKEYYFYHVRTERDNCVIAVPEEALKRYLG